MLYELQALIAVELRKHGISEYVATRRPFLPEVVEQSYPHENEKLELSTPRSAHVSDLLD